MEVDVPASENMAMNESGDITKPVTDQGAGDAATPHAERAKRKNRKYTRSFSKDGVSSAVGTVPKYRNWKNSRRSRSGRGRGLPKKGGAGGKGVWGAMGSEMLEEYDEDTNDPNYDPEAVYNGDIEFKQVIVEATPEEIIHKSTPVILEYFEHGDSNAAADEFLEFVTASRSPLVCETIVEIALDHKPSHCEMASILISDLYGRVFTMGDIEIAFEGLLKKLPDLVLDTPDAVMRLSNFMARAIADDCLPPKFVENMAKEDLNEQAKQAVHRANTLLNMKLGLMKLDNIWGVGGGIRPVKALITQIHDLLHEYRLSGDVNEAVRCVNSLEVPHFHHEIVYEAIIMALETPSAEDAVVEFLCEIHKSSIITPKQMELGFTRILEDMKDIELDVPLACVIFDRFVEKCQKKFQLSEKIISKMPARGRKRFVSEGDSGAIKGHTFSYPQ